MAAVRAQRKSLPVYIVPSELHRLLDATENERDRMLIEFLWNTGARISEALAVRAGDITRHGVRLPNLKQGIWREQEDGTKKHVSVQAEKHVILHPDFLARLKAYTRGMRAAQALFGRLTDGRAISRKTAWVIITRAANRAGVLKKRFGDESLRPVWPHTLRHSYAVHLLENSIPVTVAMEQLGHSSLGSTQVYTKIADPRKQELIAGITF